MSSLRIRRRIRREYVRTMVMCLVLRLIIKKTEESCSEVEVSDEDMLVKLVTIDSTDDDVGPVDEISSDLANINADVDVAAKEATVADTMKMIEQAMIHVKVFVYSLKKEENNHTAKLVMLFTIGVNMKSQMLVNVSFLELLRKRWPLNRRFKIIHPILLLCKLKLA